MAFTAGRMLGGTSSINAMTFNRGSRHDYDNWANITGDGTWGYDHMMKYFRRIEDYQGDFPSDQHGYGGPITITRPRYAPGLDTWLQAGTQLGYQILDPNGPQEISKSQKHLKFMQFIFPCVKVLKVLPTKKF